MSLRSVVRSMRWITVGVALLMVGDLSVGQTPGSKAGSKADTSESPAKTRAKSQASASTRKSSRAAQLRSGRSDADDGMQVMTPAREAAAITFAQRHHAELADLVRQLKSANRAQYQRAIRDLFKSSERLARLEERDPEKHVFALKLWKLESRIRLLAARLTMTGSADLERELKDTLLQRNEVRLSQMRLDRDRFQARIERLDKSIANLSANRTTSVDREIARMKRSLGVSAARNAKRPKKTNARNSAVKDRQSAGAEPKGKSEKQVRDSGPRSKGRGE